MKNNYIALGLIFGTGVGIIFGVATSNLAIGISIGLGAGIALGAALESILRNQKNKCEIKKSNI